MRVYIAASGVLAILLGSGCFRPIEDFAPPQELAEEASEAEALFGQWKVLAKAEHTTENAALASIIVLNLFEMDELNRVIEYLGDPEATPESKVFAVRCLAPHVGAREVSALGALCEEGRDSTTRASAAALLGLTDSAIARVPLAKLAEDTESRVAFAARLGLARLGDDSVRTGLTDEYRRGALSAPERYEVIRLVLENTKPEDNKLLTKAVIDRHISTDQRILIAGTLGSSGDESAVEPLEQSKNLEDDPAYHTLADVAIEAARARGAGTN